MPLFVDIEKNFDTFCLKAKFEVEKETLALLGASGCGKSMTLRCIAGVVRPDRGKIILDGTTLFDSEKGIHLLPQERNCGLMFQNYALFPQMTVEQNLMAGAHRHPKAQRRTKVEETLKRFGIGTLREQYPDQLSGGQQQRVALARMLINEPRLLMLDEPFSALDSHLRFRMEQETRRVIQAFKGPVLLVSHDRDEVFRMADRIAVMRDGGIDVIGSRHDVFRNPKTHTAAVLTGCKNISSIRRISENCIFAEDWGIELKLSVGDHARFAGIRMHDIQPGSANVDGSSGGQFPPDMNVENVFECRVLEVIENSFSFTIMLSPLGAANASMPIAWEINKDVWERLHADIVTVSLPPRALFELKE